MLGHFRIPYPPIEEQKAIISQVELAQAKTRKLTDHLLLSVNLAKERRAALITAAVTGQIPVEEMRI
jgi:type I restriction enzyme, S subunit